MTCTCCCTSTLDALAAAERARDVMHDRAQQLTDDRDALRAQVQEMGGTPCA